MRCGETVTIRMRDTEEGEMTLQFVHKTIGAPRASSLYCKWIHVRRGEDARLVAIWIDPEMRAFAAGMQRETGRNEEASSVEKITDELPIDVQENEGRTIRIEETQRQ